MDKSMIKPGKILIAITMLAVLLFLQPASVLAEEAGKDDFLLYAQSAVLMDGDSGRILYEKNSGEIRPMASTTKIMTCILALENGNPEDQVKVSAYAASMPDVQLNIKSGETYYLGDLLYSLMLESHNDTAVAIAEHIGGTVEGFSTMMNQKARDIGCENTNFVTPNGLDAEGHVTTAADLAKIMRYCVKYSPKRDQFLEITRTQSRSFTDIDQKRSHYCGNHNAFLTMMDGALSGKTGFTGKAGYCYVGAVEKDGKSFIVALLGCGWPPHKTYKWSDMKTLAQYGLKNYEYRDVFEKNMEFPVVFVEDGQTESTTLGLNLNEEEKSLKLLLRGDETCRIEKEIPEKIEAPVKAGDQVGRVAYYIDDQVAAVYPVYALDTVDRIDFTWCLKKVLSFWNFV